LRALLAAIRARNGKAPMLEHALGSNRIQIRRAFEAIMARRPTRVGMVGSAFKPGLDDVRNSPFLELGAMLAERGVALAWHDPHVRPERLKTPIAPGRPSC
jgi:UDP-glucose 6-dehydrogenase